MQDLERISITIEPDLLSALDEHVARSGHANRSKAVCDFIRAGLRDVGPDDRQVVGVVAITYDHEARAIADHLVQHAHRHEGRVLATTHLHLDARHCLEMSALSGSAADVRHYADHVMGMKGVEYGGLLLTRPLER
ncbi:MAG: nickel-responsive transcriptional regulator NikR [Deltaproteobacteria bacterium]|nr:nickel-responsive transcriptional regulator NikR [Deltaproteobacteria bacterium]